MITLDHATICAHCYSIIEAGSPILPSPGGLMYCSPGCFAKGEEDETFDDEEMEDEDDDTED